MSILSPPEVPPTPVKAIGTAARPQWSLGRLLSRAIVILIGMGVGWIIAMFIGALTGWIEIPIC